MNVLLWIVQATLAVAFALSGLTPTAGIGLAALAALAAGMHIRRKEPSGAAVTATLLVLATLVAWGRYGPYS